MFLLATVTIALTAAAPPSTQVCKSNDTTCADSFSNTKYGCCTLPNAVCCTGKEPQAPFNYHIDAFGGLNTGGGYCCPTGSKCSSKGCVDTQGTVADSYGCGPSQGTNCSMSYVCHPGPLPFDAKGSPVVMVMGDSVSLGWTPQLKALISSTSFTVHTPAAGDGGARSTTNGNRCMDYFLTTSTMEPLNLVCA